MNSVQRIIEQDGGYAAPWPAGWAGAMASAPSGYQSPPMMMAGFGAPPPAPVMLPGGGGPMNPYQLVARAMVLEADAQAMMAQAQYLRSIAAAMQAMVVRSPF